MVHASCCTGRPCPQGDTEEDKRAKEEDAAKVYPSAVAPPGVLLPIADGKMATALACSREPCDRFSPSAVGSNSPKACSVVFGESCQWPAGSCALEGQGGEG